MKLLQGDCLSLLPSLPDSSIDMVLADPPYGTTQCKWDSVIDLAAMWRELERVCKPNAAIVMTAAQPFTAQLVCSNIGMFKYEIIWEKGNATGFLNAKKQPLRAHESVLVFYRQQPTYNPQMTSGHARKTSKRKTVNSECYGKALSLTEYDSTERYPRSVQFFSSDKQRGSYHATQKPVALMEWLIRSFSNPGDVVLYFCMGSGTTGVACINTDREFIGMEMDAGIFKVATDRIIPLMNKEAA
ncbi:site-specific DNA-methyltransferase [Aeromonas caviae]|uniref:DNA-methyltransferase n=1 Tax=Aeromonas caviae TaxID=648 RepID=UPI0024C72E89|nr:site-specific DNA-methyltransferase [Aeromonas caviae]WAF62679.1 site-specific DNA-methyltransferase [Aeromonas caviae]WAF79518.1 site-specific DNA-methyltransferase [Aeromonas caviae]